MACRSCSLDDVLQRLFFRYAHVVYEYCWLFLLLPFLLTIACSTGLVFLKVQEVNSTEYVFTPTDGQAIKDREVFKHWWPLDPEHYTPGKSFAERNWLDVLAVSIEGDNIITDTHLKALDDFNQYILRNFSISSLDGERRIYYHDLCLNWEGQCYDNGHIEMLINQRRLAEYIQLTYPRGGKGDTPIYFGSLIAKPVMNDSSGEFREAKAIRLTYSLKQEPETEGIEVYSKIFRDELRKYIYEDFENPYIDLGVCHSESLDEAMVKLGYIFIPNFIITFSVLTTFSMFCGFVLIPRHKFGKGVGFGLYIDWVRSKPMLALAGIFTAMMGIGSSFGVLLWCDFEYNMIATVMPFLIVAIGVDDMFIMTAAWHRTNPYDSVSVRLAHTLGDAAVSITITSLTDALSFGIGCYTTLPGVWIFCAYTCLAVVFCYFYQITFFAAVLCLVGRLEKSGKHCFLYTQAVHPDDADTVMKRVFNSGVYHQDHNQVQGSNNTLENTDQEVDVYPDPKHIHETNSPSQTKSSYSHLCQVSDDEETMVCRFFRYYYGPLILHPVSKVLVLFTAVVYFAFAIWGVFCLKEGLDPGNLVVKPHYVSDYLDYLWLFTEKGMQIDIAVSNVPDLRNSTDREHILEMVRTFEESYYCLGNSSTMFWMYEYINYLDDLGAPLDVPQRWTEDLKYWLKYTGGSSHWRSDIVWTDPTNENDYNMSAIRFKLGLNNFLGANDHRWAAVEYRRIANMFPEFNVTVYQPYFPFSDQYMIVLPSTLRNIGIAIGCMVIVALALIPNIFTALLITLAIISIDLGVIGYMALWSVNLDCVSMITIIMSIGFAVDLSAHISFAYVKAEGTSRQRAIRALETLGWPVFQGASSTILGVLVLMSVNAYLIQTFFKTVFLVIVFGMLHSLVFLPVALTVVMPNTCCSCNSRKKVHNITTVDVEPNVITVQHVKKKKEHNITANTTTAHLGKMIKNFKTHDSIVS